jgi:hypothetical protein
MIGMSHQNAMAKIRNTNAELNAMGALLNAPNIPFVPPEPKPANFCSEGVVSETLINDLFENIKSCAKSSDKDLSSYTIVFEKEDGAHKTLVDFLTSLTTNPDYVGKKYTLLRPTKKTNGVWNLVDGKPGQSKQSKQRTQFLGDIFMLDPVPTQQYIELRFVVAKGDAGQYFITWSKYINPGPKRNSKKGGATRKKLGGAAQKSQSAFIFGLVIESGSNAASTALALAAEPEGLTPVNPVGPASVPPITATALPPLGPAASSVGPKVWQSYQLRPKKKRGGFLTMRRRNRRYGRYTRKA